MRREARLDIEAPESRGHRVEAAVQALAVAAIAEKRCTATKIFISDLPPRFPSPLRRRGDGDEETEGPGRRSQTLDDTWWTPRRHPTVRFGLCCARRKRRGSNDKSAFGLDFHEQNLISPFFARVPKRNAEIATLRPRSASLVSVE
jgi:hypothetical protein